MTWSSLYTQRELTNSAGWRRNAGAIRYRGWVQPDRTAHDAHPADVLAGLATGVIRFDSVSADLGDITRTPMFNDCGTSPSRYWSHRQYTPALIASCTPLSTHLHGPPVMIFWFRDGADTNRLAV